MSRGDLTEVEWRVLKGLLPIEPANRGRGRRPEHNRAIINGILWRMRCGIAWRDVPPSRDAVTDPKLRPTYVARGASGAH